MTVTENSRKQTERTRRRKDKKRSLNVVDEAQDTAQGEMTVAKMTFKDASERKQRRREEFERRRAPEFGCHGNARDTAQKDKSTAPKDDLRSIIQKAELADDDFRWYLAPLVMVSLQDRPFYRYGTIAKPLHRPPVTSHLTPFSSDKLHENGSGERT